MSGLMSRSLEDARPCADPDVEAADVLAKGVRRPWLVMGALRVEHAADPAVLAVLTSLADVLPTAPRTPEEAR